MFLWGRRCGFALVLLGVSWFGIQPLLAAVPLQIGQNFAGAREGVDSAASPADGNGAVGPRHFVELINGRYSVYVKTTGERVQTSTDLKFWNAAGIAFSST